MERMKRPQPDSILDHNNNKKLKLQDPSILTINTNKSLLEDLANETLYQIFDYLDIHHAHEAFFDLNKRFRNLFLYSNLPIQVNISTMSKSTFELYHKNVIIPNKHRINYLRLSNPFTVDIIFSPPRFISKFIRLQTLVLDQIKAKYFENIFIQLNLLPELYSLTINPIDQIKNSTLFYLQIFRLPKLKYCQVQFEVANSRESLLLVENRTSSIEHLVIKNNFQLRSFGNLLLYLPRLRHLSISNLNGSFYPSGEFSPIILSDFKTVSLKLDLISFDQFERVVKNFFSSIEKLRLTTHYDSAYLDAKRWEQLIVSSMPNLRVFDLNHDGSVHYGPLSYHDLISQFNSSFWTKRKWFFTHQHDWQERLDSAVLHSTDPYRRNDYTFYWELDGQLCPHLQETNLNVVKHVRIGSKQATKNIGNYFPNATELTIKNDFKTPDLLIATTLNRVVPLQKLTKLVIDYFHFPFEQILELIRFTPNLLTLKFYLLSINKKSFALLQQSDLFRYISTTNKIKSLELTDRCTLEQIRMLVHLFPRLESFKIAMKRKEIGQIIRYLLAKDNHQTHHLFFLCISQAPKVCLREVNQLIRWRELLNDYFIKFINHDLYLWW